MQDNLVQTFQLEGPNLRGRVVRLGSVLHDLLHRHDYPEPVGRLTGEAAVLALLLSSMLKYDGIFTLQIQSDGPVSMLVADITQKSILRAMAKYKAGEIPLDIEYPADLLGKGHLAFTVDQGEGHERYQGIVSLTGHSLQDSVQHYFTQSEQITTAIRMVVGKVNGLWRAGAIMLQRLPEQAARIGETEEDDWRRAMILMQSCKDEELLDPALSQNDLLFRLFHEEEVRVFDPDIVEEGCRCSRERAEGIVAMMSPEEKQDMTVDGRIQVKCEFCDREYDFETDTLPPLSRREGG
jgi:molecular chaperone Hsp33